MRIIDAVMGAEVVVEVRRNNMGSKRHGYSDGNTKAIEVLIRFARDNQPLWPRADDKAEVSK